MQSVRFRLQIHHPLEPGLAETENPPTPLPLFDLQGDQTQLAELAEVVETYVQNLLRQSYHQLNLGLPWHTDPADAETDPWEHAPHPSAPTLPPADSSTPSPSGGPSLSPGSLVTHVLDIGDTWRTTGATKAGRVGVPQDPIALTVSQLFDLANTLDESRQEIETLPVQETPARLLPQSQPVWAKTVAMFVLALGLTGGVGWWITSGGLLQVASDSPETGVAPASQPPVAPNAAPPAVNNPQVAPPGDRPLANGRPSSSNPKNKPGQTLAQNPSGSAVNESTDPAAKESVIATGQAPPNSPAQTEAGNSATGSNPTTGTTQNTPSNPNLSRTRSTSTLSKTSQDAIALAGNSTFTGADNLATRLKAHSKESPSVTQGKAPPADDTAIALAPELASREDSLEARTSTLDGQQFSTTSKLQGEVITTQEQAQSPAGIVAPPAAVLPPPAPPAPIAGPSTDLSGPVAQVRSYFLRQWTAQQGGQQPLSYSVELNPNGTVRSVSPARANSPSLSLPSPGQALTIPLSSGQVETVRVDLNPDGSVDAQLQ
jgi:hypothetical protein